VFKLQYYQEIKMMYDLKENSNKQMNKIVHSEFGKKSAKSNSKKIEILEVSC
jgi:hypothetical protein